MDLTRQGDALDRQARVNENTNQEKIEKSYGAFERELQNTVENVSNEAFDKVVGAAKLDWGEPVSSLTALPTDDANGKTRMVRDTGKVYRFNGIEWIEIQSIDPTAINEVDSRLTSQLAEIAYTDIDKFTGDDTQKLNSFLNAHAGETVRIPRNEYVISGVINVPDKTEVIAEGVKLVNKSTSHVLLSLGSGVRLSGIELEGVGNSTLINGSRGIEIKGSLDAYKNNIVIDNCYIHDFGQYGIIMEFASNVTITNSEIDKIGYAGIMGLSVNNVTVTGKTNVSNIQPGSTQAYGITFSRNSSQDLSLYPRSKDCLVEGCTITNVPLWKGLDTHGGENIKFINNTISGCKHGIGVVGISDIYAPQSIQVSNNIVTGIGTGCGVMVVGAGSLGSVLEYAENCEVSNNTFIECGIDSSDLGAISYYITKGMKISNNTLNKPLKAGLAPWYENIGMNINGNVIVDVNSSGSYADSIFIRSEKNTGTIGNNSLITTGSIQNVTVGKVGIRAKTMTGNKLSISPNFITNNIPYSGILGESADYGTIGSISRIYSSNGSPEGIIQASIGSICINYSGGRGSTLYLKETGNGTDTGWIPLHGANAASSSSRPSNPPNGTMYYDTQISKPIWYYNGVWKDATGLTV